MPEHKWFCQRCEPHSLVRASKVVSTSPLGSRRLYDSCHRAARFKLSAPLLTFSRNVISAHLVTVPSSQPTLGAKVITQGLLNTQRPQAHGVISCVHCGFQVSGLILRNGIALTLPTSRAHLDRRLGEGGCCYIHAVSRGVTCVQRVASLHSPTLVPVYHAVTQAAAVGFMSHGKLNGSKPAS